VGETSVSGERKVISTGDANGKTVYRISRKRGGLQGKSAETKAPGRETEKEDCTSRGEKIGERTIKKPHNEVWETEGELEKSL